MKTARPELKRCLDYLKDALPDLQAVYLFGSQAKGNANAISDVDLAALLPSPLAGTLRWELTGQLADLLNRDVDLVDLRSASTVMQHQIVSEGQRLWSRDLEADEFELATMSQYWDLAIQRRELIADIKQRGHVHGR
ncbi:type VII toxin-antitoxin system MntA family adenylyltransferase antitoxin [Modicisalibacter xianhensis]|uniref:Predicted nucleotidyltransferase n=1 Tax=Modicisalibacter xianhensis TaxID=442341 RepID=A0A1I3C7I1_9GAMM|nr:nucleotidyltransferase domain-containing protein [Halomonas xianhensis]SFH70514.1 Predicted nucleotidyltransferase [Halomonas xianhensis]